MDDIVGHHLQKKRLQIMERSGRLPGCLIFVGVSGVGKFTVAQAFAQSLLCSQKNEACGVCGSCLRVAKGQSESLLIVEPKGAHIVINQAREIIHFFSLKTQNPHRVIIINEAHKLNSQASNALLKSLEEPPPGVHFILVAETLSSLLPTIRSRSQILRFSPLEDDEVAQVTGASGWVLQVAQGRVDRADQLMNEDVGQVRQRSQDYWTDLLNKKSPLECVSSLENELKDRSLSFLLIQFWQQLIKESFYLKSGQDLSQQNEVTSALSQFSYKKLSSLSEQLVKLEQDLQGNADKTLSFEHFSLNAFRECHGTQQI